MRTMAIWRSTSAELPPPPMLMPPSGATDDGCALVVRSASQVDASEADAQSPTTQAITSLRMCPAMLDTIAAGSIALRRQDPRKPMSGRSRYPVPRRVPNLDLDANCDRCVCADRDDRGGYEACVSDGLRRSLALNSGRNARSSHRCARPTFFKHRSSRIGTPAGALVCLL